MLMGTCQMKVHQEHSNEVYLRRNVLIPYTFHFIGSSLLLFEFLHHFPGEVASKWDTRSVVQRSMPGSCSSSW
jgi:hypothetical protein